MPSVVPRACRYATFPKSASWVRARAASRRRKSSPTTAFRSTCPGKSDRVGGNWGFKNRNGMSVGLSFAAYPHIAHTRWRTRFSDAARFSRLSAITQITRYFERLCRSLRLSRSDRVQRRRLEGRADGGRLVEGDARGRRDPPLRRVVRREWGTIGDPRLPEPAFPGSFSGKQIHSHAYIDPSETGRLHRQERARGRLRQFGARYSRASSDARALPRTCSCRSGAAIGSSRNISGGEVLDSQVSHPSEEAPLLQRAMPPWLMRRLAERRLAQTAGRPEQYGLMKPDHHLLERTSSGREPGNLRSRRLGRRAPEAQYQGAAQFEDRLPSTATRKTSTSSSGAPAIRSHSRSSTRARSRRRATTLRCAADDRSALRQSVSSSRCCSRSAP